MIVTVDAAMREAERHPPRSPERRAACHLWSSLITSATIAAAQRAITSFGDDHVQAAALDLLGRLATEHRHAVTQQTGRR